jgi:uncharacterized repeat protein (TIGR01451 family)
VSTLRILRIAIIVPAMLALNIALNFGAPRATRPAWADDPSCDLPITAQSDIKVTKTIKPTDAIVGDTLTETIVITNNGPCDAHVQMNDFLSPAQEFTAVSGNTCTEPNPFQVQCEFDLADDSSKTITVFTKATQPGPLACDFAEAHSTDVLLDPDPTNNSSFPPVCANVASAPTTPPSTNPTTPGGTTNPPGGTTNPGTSGTSNFTPAGGVDTGAGGTAHRSPLLPLAALAVAFGTGGFLLRLRLRGRA